MFRESPDLELLCRVKWTLWGTLTFRGEKSSSVQERMWFHLVRLGSARFGLKPSKLLWVRRSELGELGGRFHYHFLMAGTNVQKLGSLAQSWWLSGCWEGLAGGMARVEPYQTDASGALPYLLKSLNGGLAYETGKFAAMSSQLISSDGLRALIASILRLDEKFSRQSESAWTGSQELVGASER